MRQTNPADIKNADELEFTIFCIENVAARLGVPADKVYSIIADQSDILDHYIIPEYEVLHTQSLDYIVSEILDVMNEKRVYE